jgi:crotonobetainyl-CoA:carnitine CoA-transferase CaiB-like acyl-CoA transferase
VIDLSQAVLGPVATMMLADFGADVIKVERPGAGDLLRNIPTARIDPAGPNNPVFASVNRNKRSISLDLKQSADVEALRDLVREADVLVNNFRPGVMDRLGLGYAELAATNPGLVYASGTGFGARGPLSHKGGQDVLGQAISGVMSRKADPGHPTAIYSTSIADYTAGMHLAQGILIALLARQATGRGQEVEVSLYDSMLALQGQEAAMVLTRGIELNWGQSPLSATFEAADRPFVIVGAFREHPLRDICAAIGAPHIAEDERFCTEERLRGSGLAIRGVLQEIFAKAPRDHWLAKLEAADILCAPVQTLPEALSSEQTRVNDMIWRAENGSETQTFVASPIHLSATPATLRRGSPSLGQDEDGVLAGGCSSAS